MKKFKIISKNLIINEEYCKIEKQTVLTHENKETTWFVHQTADAAIVVPVFKTGEILLQKTYKHGAGKFIIEFPAGMINKKESPAHAAARELREETGLVAEKIVKIGSVISDPTGSPMRYHFFVALNCKAIADQELDPSEQIETFLIKNFATAKKYLLSSMQPKDLKANNLTNSFQTSAATISSLPFAEEFFAKNSAS